MKKYYTRQKKGKAFWYYDGEERITDEEVIARIQSLAIPPAWKEVTIATSSKARVQARGRDAAGRSQTIYSQAYRLQQEKLKFDRILRFADRLPALRRRIDTDIKRKRLSKDKVLACIVKLIDQSYFRVGNDIYAKEHQTYGITTLRSKHLTIQNNTVIFDFIGKSGQAHVKKIQDRQLVSIIKRLDELPGYELFRYQDEKGAMHDLHSSDVNAYIKQHMGEEFTAKDFRTWGGTLLATAALLEETLDTAGSQTVRKKMVSGVVKRVSKRLGNTPAVARSSYIDPRVLAAYDDGETFPKLQKAIKRMHPRKYLSVEEQCVLKVLAK
jgi:DNA topoisomerase-1